MGLLEGAKVHLAKMELNWELPLIDVEFKLNERVNLFIGPNASGKSTILRAVKKMHAYACGKAPVPMIGSDDGRITNVPAHEAGVGWLYLNYESILENEPTIALKASDDWQQAESGAVWNSVPFLYVPATRIPLPGVDKSSKLIMGKEASGVALIDQLFGVSSDVPTVFDPQDLELLMKFYQNERPPSIRRALQTTVQIGYSCAKSICSEVIHDIAPYPFVEGEQDIEENYWIDVHHNMGIGTSDIAAAGPLYAGDLSMGSQGTLMWIWYMAIGMALHYGWSDGWEKKPAILLIDEIENHIHPTWQRRVIPALLEHFPGLQIFATTHSPFVVAGLKAGQVHLLRRSDNGMITATTRQEDIVGWTADEILRNMMGVDDPTDDETAAAARELRDLRNEGPRDDPDAEAERQERMLELRQRVDRDLLAGGPWKRQREQFEQDFADVLQKYRQSRDLGQENG